MPGGANGFSTITFGNTARLRTRPHMSTVSIALPPASATTNLLPSRMMPTGLVSTAGFADLARRGSPGARSHRCRRAGPGGRDGRSAGPCRTVSRLAILLTRSSTRDRGTGRSPAGRLRRIPVGPPLVMITVSSPMHGDAVRADAVVSSDPSACSPSTAALRRSGTGGPHAVDLRHGAGRPPARRALADRRSRACSGRRRAGLGHEQVAAIAEREMPGAVRGPRRRC